MNINYSTVFVVLGGMTSPPLGRFVLRHSSFIIHNSTFMLSPVYNHNSKRFVKFVLIREIRITSIVKCSRPLTQCRFTAGGGVYVNFIYYK